MPYSLYKKKSGSEEPPSHNSGYAIKRSRVSRSLSSLCCLDLLDQFGHDLEQVAHDAVVGNTEDGCALILVDSDDALRILHTSGVLDGTGDTQSNIDLGMHGLTGLTDLMVSGHPACIGDGTGSTHNAAAQSGSQLLSQLNALVDILADATANGDDDVGADQIDQLLSGLLNAQDLGLDVGSSQR